MAEQKSTVTATPPGTVQPGAEGKRMQVINLAAADKAPAFPNIKNNKSGGWVNFGLKNDFPTEIIKMSSRSPVNDSIIESTVTYVCGKGVRTYEADNSEFVGAPNTGESWDNIIEPIAKDYKTFGGFYFQVIKNKNTTTVSLFHQDFTTVRIGQINEFGDPITFRIANDWAKTSGKNKPLELEVWPGITKAKTGQAYLYYHWDYKPGLHSYCVPDWFAAREYVKADGTLGTFYNNSINNGFTPSVVISMPSNPADEKKEEFQTDMENAFTGAEGASSVVILWGENDTVKPVIVPFAASGNADIYNNVEGIIFQKIISAHRLSSPTLAGVSGSGNLSGNAAEIIDAYVLYNFTVIEKMRKRILDSLNIFTKINKTGALIIDDLDVLPKIRETEAPEDDTQPVAATLTRQNKFVQLLTRLFKWK